MILIDTSVWIDFFRAEDSPERRVLDKLIENEEDISISEIILTEILQGIKEEKTFRTISSYLLDVPMYKAKSIHTYVNAARIYRQCQRSGKTIRKTVDCIIAAICLEHDLAILHRDRDFEMIAVCTGLKTVQA